MAVPLMRSYTTPGLALNVFGPIPVAVSGQAGGKQLSFSSGQVATGGGIAAYSFLMKYANLF